MKRIAVLLLAMILCLSGCRKTPPGIPGAEEVPVGVDWRLWERYLPAELTMGDREIPVLIALDAIRLAIYYDQPEQELLGSVTIYTPLSDVEYSLERLRILDMNGDGYDDIGILDILTNGDRTLECWLWAVEEEEYLYAPEYSQFYAQVGADISWQEGKHFIASSMAMPEDTQELLILVEEPWVYVYLDQREQVLVGKAQLPEPLSREAEKKLAEYTYLDSWDANGDGWSDLQLPCRWETQPDGSVVLYCHCWLWEPESGTYRYDPVLSAAPAL